MKQHIASSFAAILVFTAAAAAQIPNRAPSQGPVTGTSGRTGQPAPAPTAGRTETLSQVTVTGCVTRESEATGERGGPLNSGVGSGNEFVLVRAAPSGAAAPASTDASRADAKPAAISYSLTGSRERELTGLVGRQVEIVGTLEGTHGTLRELNIASFKDTGACKARQ